MKTLGTVNDADTHKIEDIESETTYLDRVYTISIEAIGRPMKTSTSSENETIVSHVHA